MHPNPGTTGPLKLKMYRGIRPQKERFHKDFASDPGDYGCGEYWTDTEEFAGIYGKVISKEIVLDNVYHIPKEELAFLINKYRTCKMEDGFEERRFNSMRLTQLFISKGYQAVLTSGYESFEEKGLCIFSSGNLSQPTR